MAGSTLLLLHYFSSIEQPNFERGHFTFLLLCFLRLLLQLFITKPTKSNQELVLFRLLILRGCGRLCTTKTNKKAQSQMSFKV